MDCFLILVKFLKDSLEGHNPLQQDQSTWVTHHAWVAHQVVMPLGPYGPGGNSSKKGSGEALAMAMIYCVVDCC